MAKRTSAAGTTTRKSSAKRSVKAQEQSYSAAVEQAVNEQIQKPTMSPQTSTPAEMAHEMSQVTHDMIAQRAYEIWRSEGGEDVDNWLRAERELRGNHVAAM